MTFGTILLIWLAMGAATAWIASSKGRSMVGWFFIGLFLGVIGLILAVVMSSKNTELNYN